MAKRAPVTNPRNPAARYPRGPPPNPLRPSQVRGGLGRGRQTGSPRGAATPDSSPGWAGRSSGERDPARIPAEPGPSLSGARAAGRPRCEPAASWFGFGWFRRCARAGVRAARAPAAQQLPAGEPINAGRSGGHFLVGPVARLGQLGLLRGRAGTAASRSGCVHWSGSQGWARVPEGAPLQTRQKETLGRRECRLAGRLVGFSCVVFRINRSRKRDVEAATQTGQTR